ncbi:MAG: hypothetical protein HY319_31230 [Armatimonadetes bacterium]|nr:hypothetical protein [Armatimonadota bacterium]
MKKPFQLEGPYATIGGPSSLGDSPDEGELPPAPAENPASDQEPTAGQDISYAAAISWPPEQEVRLARELGRHTCAACNTELARRQGTQFCIQCGLPVEQRCPYCRKGIPTRSGSDLTCPECTRRLRSCRECLRYYPPEDLTCINTYCPQFGVPWTLSAGTGVWPHAGGDAARSSCASKADPERLVPQWRWTAPEQAELLNPVNAMGVVFCASRQGWVWSFFEPGAERPDAVPGGYERVPLPIHTVRLDAAVTTLATRSGSLYLGLQGARMARLDIASQRVTPLGTFPATPEHLLSLPIGLVCAGGRHAWLVDTDDRVRHLVSVEDCPSATPLPPVTIGEQDVVIGWNVHRAGAVEFECRILRRGSPAWEPLAHFPEEVDFVLGGEQLYCCSRQTVRRMGPDGAVQAFSLKAPVQVRPALDQANRRLIFCLTDGSIRTCRYDGQGLAFRHQATGTVSGPPLLLGRTVLHGVTEARLYLGQEIASPLLSGPVTPHLSCTNGRVFATTEKGGLYAFRLEP